MPAFFCKDSRVNAEYQYLGRVEHSSAVEMMEDKLETAAREKKTYWWGLEHERVYTCGLTTRKEHIVDPGLNTTSVRRGGSVAVHHPGQLVFYSVFPLSMIRGGLQAYIRFLEASIIETIWSYQTLAFLNPPHTGVWTPRGKIAFVGLGLKKGVIYHGVAVNLVNDLSDYMPIHSCGVQLPVTKLENERNIYGDRVSLRKEDILEEFSLGLKNNLEKRFVKVEGGEFRIYMEHKKEAFPESMLAFRMGQLFFNERRYWEAHEAWEVFWQNYKEGDFKRFLGGLIQLASALYKLTSKPNLKGALSLMRKSLDKLRSSLYVDVYLTLYEGQVPIVGYIEAAVKRLEAQPTPAQETGSPGSPLFIPYILASRYDQVSIAGYEKEVSPKRGPAK